MFLNLFLFFVAMPWCYLADVVTELIEGMVETYPNLQYLNGFPEVLLSRSFRSSLLLSFLMITIPGKEPFFNEK
jgi:hypothetical protein